MRLFVDMADASICGNITSAEDDVSRYKPLTSGQNRRQSVQSELFSKGIDISNFAKSYCPRKTAKEDRTMDGINKKLAELEKRTASLQIVYDSLLNRAVDLESRARVFEAEVTEEKSSFDIVELLMKQDGRSKAMFNYVSLFFYVLLSKLKEKALPLSSTTDLWTRLSDEDVKTAFENVLTNLGFHKKEIRTLHVLLDVLHERDITVNVNQSEVDTYNLTSKLKYLGSEFIVANPETDNEEDVNVPENETIISSTSDNLSNESDSCSSSIRSQDNEIESSAITGSACYQQMNVVSGDTFDVDSLLLYLQMQTDLDPHVRSALRRVVAVSHCCMVKTPVVAVGDQTLQTCFTYAHDTREQIIIPSCLNEIQPTVRSNAAEFSEEINETPLPPHQRFRSQFLEEIECDDDFCDIVTSTPKSVKLSQYTETNQTNNALVIDDIDLFTSLKAGGKESNDNVPLTNVDQYLKLQSHQHPRTSRPISLDLPDLGHNHHHKPDVNNVRNDEDHPLVDGDFDTLSRIELFLSSQQSSAPEEGQERLEHFRSFYKRRLRRKTAEYVKAERDSIKLRISPSLPRTSDELKSKLSFECEDSKEDSPPLTVFISEIYEVNRVHGVGDFSDSDYISTSSSLLSSYHFNSDTGCSLTARDDDDASISLHEELSEFGFFQCTSPKDYNIIECNDDVGDHGKDSDSSNRSETRKAQKEHVNFFSSPDSVNPYAYDFDADYYMLWPGQEMEIEMNDLSSYIHLDSDGSVQKSGQSFTNSLTSEKYDSWLIL